MRGADDDWCLFDRAPNRRKISFDGRRRSPLETIRRTHGRRKLVEITRSGSTATPEVGFFVE